MKTYPKITKSKNKSSGHGPSGEAPACQAQGPEFKPSTARKRKEAKI
jgi:hypothetical protein